MKKIDALKWLSILSLIGFLYCFVTDLGFFMLFLESSKNSQDFGSVINIIIENLDDNGFVFNEYIASQVKKLYAVRVVFDLLAMVGVAFMFFKIKIGWTFYWIFQVAYFLSPYVFLNFQFEPSWPYFTGIAFVMFPLFNNMIHLVYVLLFMSQKEQLI